MSDVRLISRVASRFGEKLARGWDGKLASKEWRLQWSRAMWLLEELPAKGKRKLRRAELQNPGDIGGGASQFIPDNILRDAKIGTGDSFDQVKDKLLGAYMLTIDETISGEGKWGDRDMEYVKKNESWLRNVKWYENQVFYLEVIPEGVEDFTAEGKDFTVSVKWTSWSAYDPRSDFNQADPHYTQYASTAPTSARKMYQTLKANPDALKSLTWSKFDEWLKANKIGYKLNFSVWH